MALNLILSIVAEKGGVAKTATALSLAGAFRELGHTVTLYDSDPQMSLFMLCQPINDLPCKVVTPAQIASIPREGIAIIDTPSRLDEEARAALLRCDFAIIAAACQFESMQQLDRTARFAERHAPQNWRMLLTLLDTRSNHAPETAQVIRDRYEGKVLPEPIRENVAVPDAHAMGGTLFDRFPRSVAANGYRAAAAAILQLTQ